MLPELIKLCLGKDVLIGLITGIIAGIITGLATNHMVANMYFKKQLNREMELSNKQFQKEKERLRKSALKHACILMHCLFYCDPKYHIAFLEWQEACLQFCSFLEMSEELTKFKEIFIALQDQCYKHPNQLEKMEVNADYWKNINQLFEQHRKTLGHEEDTFKLPTSHKLFLENAHRLNRRLPTRNRYSSRHKSISK